MADIFSFETRKIPTSFPGLFNLENVQAFSFPSIF